MKKTICIICPRGCHLSVGDAPEYPVSGNACPRGERYGREEMISPKRTVTATCPVAAETRPVALESANSTAEAAIGAPDESSGFVPLSRPRRVPVRTAGAIPRECVFRLVELLLRTPVSLPVRAGDVILENWEDTGISVIATRDIS